MEGCSRLSAPSLFSPNDLLNLDTHGPSGQSSPRSLRLSPPTLNRPPPLQSEPVFGAARSEVSRNSRRLIQRSTPSPAEDVNSRSER